MGTTANVRTLIFVGSHLKADQIAEILPKDTDYTIFAVKFHAGIPQEERTRASHLRLEIDFGKMSSGLDKLSVKLLDPWLATYSKKLKGDLIFIVSWASLILVGSVLTRRDTFGDFRQSIVSKTGKFSVSWQLSWEPEVFIFSTSVKL